MKPCKLFGHLMRYGRFVYKQQTAFCGHHQIWRCFSENIGNIEKFGRVDSPIFKPMRVVILSRITRYEFEKLMYKDLNEEEFKAKLLRKRSHYELLLERHETHYSCLEQMKKSLKQHGIETVVVQRPEFTKELLDWADAIFTAGGDGTFLDAASKILTTDKPVIGINTDPTRSEGRLLLSRKKYPASNFDAALDKLLNKDFKWLWRHRLRITMSGYHANDEPIELSNQQLKMLEHRYIEHVAEHEEVCSRPLYLKGVTTTRVLPIRALNEVFVGECLSSRVSYYELSVDHEPGEKQKSSGLTVCTGTGSSSWHLHTNKIQHDAIKDILTIANQESQVPLPVNDDSFVERVTNKFNNSLLFDPSEPSMGYTVRDPIVNGVFDVPCPRGKAKTIQISSRMWDACLVLDGGSSFRFNDGAVATLEIHDEDALRTVEMN